LFEMMAILTVAWKPSRKILGRTFSLNLKHDRLYKLVSYVIKIGLLLPILMTVTPHQAKAQGLTPMQVGVIDFRNDSGYGGDMLARCATDAVVIELSKSNRFDVITRAQIQAQMKELDIKPPLNPTERERLGQELAADAMIEGAIKAVEIRGTGPTRRAVVTVVVRMVDQASQEVVNGAVQSGWSQMRVGSDTDDDKLISDAINNSAYQAVKTMIDYIIPEATVQNTIRTNEVMLNKGARDGLRVGMRMIVIRDREIIGEIQLREVDPDNAFAYVVRQIRGIRPEDKARAVFDMPEIPYLKADPSTQSGSPSLTYGKKQGLFSRLIKPVLAIATIWVLADIFIPNGTETVGAVTAEAGLSGYALPLEGGTPGVRIKWNPNKLAKGLNVVRYKIWRNDFGGPVMCAEAGDGEAFDAGQAGPVTFPIVDPLTHEMSGGQMQVPAMPLGVPLRYQVSAVYVVHKQQGAEPVDEYYETPKAPCGQATPITQITLAGLRQPTNGNQQNLQKVTFEWLSRKGADTYIVEASIDPTFRDASSMFVSNPIAFSPAADGQTVRLEVAAALYNRFRSISIDQRIYWRVGARSSVDRPGPIPADGRPDYRYIYSEVSYFLPAEVPPGHPDE
jgi:curli biogenesis system outer membrane secretion channel CsgG